MDRCAETVRLPLPSSLPCRSNIARTKRCSFDFAFHISCSRSFSLLFANGFSAAEGLTLGSQEQILHRAGGCDYCTKVQCTSAVRVVVQLFQHLANLWIPRLELIEALRIGQRFSVIAGLFQEVCQRGE